MMYPVIFTHVNACMGLSSILSSYQNLGRFQLISQILVNYTWRVYTT